MSKSLIHNVAPIIMKYNLATPENKKSSTFAAIKQFLPLLSDEKKKLSIALAALLLNSGMNLSVPYLVGHTIDTYIQAGQYHGVLINAGILLAVFATAFIAHFIQVRVMGAVAQRVLFKLRNIVFSKLQALPLAFFNQNKAGDLISRINNDTDKLNQFFSQALMQFIGNLFMITGAGIFLLSLNDTLGLAGLMPAVCILIVTRLLSSWVKNKNAASLQSVGGMSAEIQESLQNFKVIVAFNRRDYFRRRFNEANEQNFKAATKAGIANTIFMPIYEFSAYVAQLTVLAYGLYQISVGNFTVGLLISFLLYLTRFYDPLRHIASLWSSFQMALAAWERISQINAMESDLVVVPSAQTASKSLIEFKDVTFSYPEGKPVLHNINFTLEHGKTYALVGPTGGGKSTTASLAARLYDPTAGSILLNGKDIRAYTEAERTKKIGFILQDPFLFTGTIKDNLLYGNEKYANYTKEQLSAMLDKAGLNHLLSRFDKGLETPISGTGDTISLGQRQLVAFIRAVLLEPELLILDEATANIDTVTEQLLEKILKKLPSTTTKLIIAHRLNTIENADGIFFVNSGTIIEAGSMQHAVDMLMHGTRAS